MVTIKESDVYKIMALRLSKHHRKHCTGENCNISLILLMQMAEKCGAKFTSKEFKEFI